ncbi:MAG: A/G-specific adenine glycosylase, partial [Rudaea sp.]
GELLELPGVGRYTAGAIASIAFKRHEPVVDGNVTRVLARYFGITSDVTENRTREELWRLAERCLIDGRAGDVNQALMDLGATICTPRGPRCADCPVRHRCTARRLGLQAELPHKRPRKTIPRYTIGVGLVWKKGRLLIQRRKAEGLLGGLWEFPGGKREAGESLQACVEREVKEELGIQVKVKEEFAVVTHGYTHFSITMHAYACEFVRGRPRATSATAVRWVRPSELKDYAFPAANRKIIARLTE